ncbi:protein of unknown function [Atopomonas hussainii]|uniref:DUF4345 domain-containing protein n=1 Tax=Atopomonas hussainii TaxID=1429083 RepID=A0A1H7S2Y8_9GAMM|nr:DUF4345 family protein [Atopomonas hussainii]SEL66718.1 protein of unknown function [Atopomonas hussainii]
MRLKQAFLLLQALALLGFGLAYLIMPLEMAKLSGMGLLTTAALTDVRAYYGGLEIGLALYLLLSLKTEADRFNALRLLGIAYFAMFGARLAGIFIDGGEQQFNYIALGLEGVSLVLAVFLLGRRG